MTPTYAQLAVISLTLGCTLALTEETIPGSSPDWTLFEGERKLVSLSASGNTTFCPAGVQHGDGPSLGECTVAQLRFNGTSLVVRGGGGTGKVTVDDGVIKFNTNDTADDACSLLLNATGLDPNVSHFLAVAGLETQARAFVIAAVQIDGTALTAENVALDMRPAPLVAIFVAALMITLVV